MECRVYTMKKMHLARCYLINKTFPHTNTSECSPLLSSPKWEVHLLRAAGAIWVKHETDCLEEKENS